MKYRAYTQIEGEKRPRQMFGPDLEQIKAWASGLLIGAPAGTTVRIYEEKETLIEEIRK